MLSTDSAGCTRRAEVYRRTTLQRQSGTAWLLSKEGPLRALRRGVHGGAARDVISLEAARRARAEMDMVQGVDTTYDVTNQVSCLVKCGIAFVGHRDPLGHACFISLHRARLVQIG